MKTKFRMLFSAITFIAGVALLFPALALPLQLAAQGQQQGVALPAGSFCEVTGTGRGRLTGFCIVPVNTVCDRFPCVSCPVGARARTPFFYLCLGILHRVDASRPCSCGPTY
jgi:hypothetical protein